MKVSPRRRRTGTHETDIRHAKLHAHYHKGERPAVQASFLHSGRWHVVRLDEDSVKYLQERGVVPLGTEQGESWF